MACTWHLRATGAILEQCLVGAELERNSVLCAPFFCAAFFYQPKSQALSCSQSVSDQAARQLPNRRMSLLPVFLFLFFAQQPFYSAIIAGLALLTIGQ